MRYIIAIGIFQAIFAAILLLRSRVRSSADGLLILLVACIGVHLSIKFFIFTFIKDVEVLSMMNTFIGFSYLPLLYLYTKKTISKDFIPASQWYVFIPFIIASLGYFSTVSVLAAAPDAGHVVLHWYNTISLWSLLSLNIVFSGWIIYFVRHEIAEPSNEKKLIIQVAALFFVMGIIGIAFSFVTSHDWTFNYVPRSLSYAILIIISIRIITYKYVAFTETGSQGANSNIVPALPIYPVFKTTDESNSVGGKMALEISGESVQGVLVSEEEPLVPAKRKEIVSQSDMFKILLKLENAMKSGQYYTDSDLTLDKLARLTKQNKYHISETLNHFVHKPFYTFVNEYRIQHVKDRLDHLSENSSDVNILELAYEAGFNSKSSFNRYFKEITSHTPTEYLNLHTKKRAQIG